jgi:hypothetical protein
VIDARLIVAAPLTTCPSTGIISPAPTTTISCSRRSSAAISASVPSAVSNQARAGGSASSRRNKLVEAWLVVASR